MPLTYIYHIGFVLETEASILVYDCRPGILIYVWHDGCLLFITSLNFVWMPIALMLLHPVDIPSTLSLEQPRGRDRNIGYIVGFRPFSFYIKAITD